MDVWSPRAGTPILLKLEDSSTNTGSGASTFAEVSVSSTQAGTWETLYFDMTGANGGFATTTTYDAVVVFPDFGTNGGGETFYFDNIEVTEVSESPLKWIKQYISPSNIHIGYFPDCIKHDNKFDLITIGFGVRNFQNLKKGLEESFRVLKPSGSLIILETSVPKNKFVKFFYLLFSRTVIPLIGSFFSKDQKAYKYLQKSAEEFPSGNDFAKIIKSCGFESVNICPQMLGASTIYIAKKNL